jgi:uncharacterized membrane protein YdjX (TVP38/TMEM64 family)
LISWILENKLKEFWIKHKFIIIKLFIVLCALSIALSFFKRFSIEGFAGFLEVLLKSKNKASAYIIFFISSIFASIIFIPISWIKITGGLLLGFWPGLLLSWPAVNIGGLVVFLICRLLGKNFIGRLFRNSVQNDNNITNIILRDLEKNGLPIVMNLQMLPILPCSIVNILCGISNISYKDYILGSLLGTLPGAIVFVNLSSNITSANKNPYNTIVSIVLFIAFNIVTYCCRKKSKFKSFGKPKSN